MSARHPPWAPGVGPARTPAPGAPPPWAPLPCPAPHCAPAVASRDHRHHDGRVSQHGRSSGPQRVAGLLALTPAEALELEVPLDEDH